MRRDMVTTRSERSMQRPPETSPPESLDPQRVPDEASSRPSQSAGSSAASFGLSPTCKPRSIASSKSTINSRSSSPWTADPDKIIAADRRGHQMLNFNRLASARRWRSLHVTAGSPMKRCASNTHMGRRVTKRSACGILRAQTLIGRSEQATPPSPKAVKNSRLVHGATHPKKTTKDCLV